MDNSLVSLPEFVALMRCPWSADDLKVMVGTGTPFPTDAAGLLPLRSALGLAIYAMLGRNILLNTRLAALVARDAANGANLDADRSIIVEWLADGEPAWAWDTGQQLPPIHMVVAVDKMFLSLATGVVTLRDRTGAVLH